MPEGISRPVITEAEARVNIYNDLGLPKTLEEVKAMMEREEADDAERTEIMQNAFPKLMPEEAAKQASQQKYSGLLHAIQDKLENE